MGTDEFGLDWATIGLIVRSTEQARQLAAGGNIMAFHLAGVAVT